MSIAQLYYPEVGFGGFTEVDGTVRFYDRVNALLPEGTATVIDFGCGVGDHVRDAVFLRRRLRDLRSRGRTVMGLDIDPRASTNPFIDEFRLLIADHPWPVEDRSVDLVLADSVLEHLPEPGLLFAEAARVLRPCGCLCIRTPNLFHYVPLISKLIPEHYHGTILAKAQPERTAEVFPAFYRCNTRRKIRAALREHGFDSAVFTHEGEPSYLGFSRLAYILGVVHQKHAPALVRSVILAFGRWHTRPVPMPS